MFLDGSALDDAKPPTTKKKKDRKRNKERKRKKDAWINGKCDGKGLCVKKNKAFRKSCKGLSRDLKLLN